MNDRVEQPGSAAKYNSQPQFFNVHEGVQYELFCGDTFFSIRVIETASMQFQGIWMFDGSTSLELLSNYDKLTRAKTPNLNLSGQTLHIEAKEDGGVISAETSKGALNVRFLSPITQSWWIPPNDVAIHQPLLTVKVQFAGREYEGIGYCKRYWYGKDIEYWSWRFISGPVQRHNQTAYLWTADAMFEFEKYNYFKLATPNGKIVAASQNDSYHRETVGFGVLDGVPCSASVRALGRWQWVARKNNSDTKIVQSFCELTFDEGGKTFKGYALHEIGAGTTR